ncbi:cytochrome b558/566 subunit A [Sulfurisphaera tokodaii]|uniref:Cytochrome b558/566 subunit A n=2 Tax=Sulfurisphaera tokodaii TaxID=111955 RepID=F9VNJ0_SULTO|nr:cytochrome b558/566 subunit A [Sulfurisphaera tokodaii]BAK54636.1 cytochrome b558/566 [Sulfurisphaera tokodaii str. 7]HII73182.1 cytochrome b558/566 subunit A [Sulfurisphaera tokodaii]
MSVKPSTKLTISIVLSVLLLGVLLAVTNTPMAQTSPDIPVYKVVGTADLSNPGSASYWSNIPWINISLTANIPMAPTSGLTHYVLVKAAWNGSWIFVLVKWYAPNPAFGAWSAAAAGIYPPAAGPGLFRQIMLTPGTTYTIEKNYTNYISIVNGKTYQGRLVLNYSGILLPTPNGTQITVLSNGSIILWHSLRPMEDLLYSDGMFYGYYTNSTWYYPDRVAMMWYMGSVIPPSKDGMNIGGKYPGQKFDGVTFKYAGGSLAQPGGAANIWMWVSGATWNNSTYDPAFKVNLWQNESLTGLPYVDPGNHGFAVPLYTNNTDMYEVDCAGIWYTPVASKGLNGSLFFIWTGATWSNGYWTVEFARPLAVPPNYANWMPNITVGKTYYVAFAVWQGKLGETLFDKSITSSFLTLQLVTTPPTSTTTTTTSVSSSTSTSAAIPSTTVDVTVAGAVIAILALVILYVVYRR